MKRFTICLLALVVVFGLAACDSSGGSSPGGAETGESPAGGSASGDAITTIEDLEATLADRYGDTAWYPDITDITIETYLGAEVLVFHTPWYADGGDWTTDNVKQTALQDALFELDPEIAANRTVLDSQGVIYGLGGSSANGEVPMSDAFALPAAPATVGEFKTWLDAVYGPGGLVTLGANETWYGAIDSVAIEDLGWGSGPELVIRTSIGATDKTQQSLLQAAITTTGSPLLESVTLFYADGASSAFSTGANAPGQSGYFYPLQ